MNFSPTVSWSSQKKTVFFLRTRKSSQHQDNCAIVYRRLQIEKSSSFLPKAPRCQVTRCNPKKKRMRTIRCSGLVHLAFPSTIASMNQRGLDYSIVVALKFESNAYARPYGNRPWYPLIFATKLPGQRWKMDDRGNDVRYRKKRQESYHRANAKQTVFEATRHPKTFGAQAN